MSEAKLAAWLFGLEPMAAGRALKSMEMQVNAGGEVIKRHELIASDVASGRRVVQRGDQLRLQDPTSGVFRDQKQLTGYGMAYAQWLVDRL